ncbi:MAG: hypothetical protein M3Y57_03180 [Acidobacteriota bacterium]|nr:hypothetical protein [Acidobacteriota bacterium]
MWRIFSSYNDRTARWAYQGLSTLGLRPLHFVSTESLVNTRVWEHRVGVDGTSIRITLPTGDTVSSSDIKGVLNRISAPALAHIKHAVKADGDYANSELTAFYLSWLHSLPCRVLNRATPQGLCGRWRHNSEWVALAAATGFPVLPYRQSCQDAEGRGYEPLMPSDQQGKSVIVLNGKLFGAEVTQQIERSCIRLAEMAGMDSMGITLAAMPKGTHVFAGASMMPLLELGGTPLLEHLLQTFGTSGGAL